MYAAAGGASIASRKARQNKAQVKGAPKKVPPKAAKGQHPQQHPKVEKAQSKQFHQLPENYHKAVESGAGSTQGGLAPPQHPSLHHSRSLTLKVGDCDGGGLRPSRSAHELADQDTEKGEHNHQPLGSPPRAYTCPHWEAKLQKTPQDRIVGFGSSDVPLAVCECAQGKAAWQEAAAVSGAGARRCSVSADPGNGGHRVKQTEAHLRWMKRNRIHDLSYGGSSSDEEEGFRARAAGAAGGLLYVGLGTVALGLVISFVGTGDKGFKTLELRWTGPALIAAGLFFCIVRILLCALPRRCQHPRPRHRPKEPAAERLLLTERPPPPPRRLSIAATALMLQNEKEQPQQHIQLQQQLKQQQQQPPSPPPPPQPPPQIIPLVLLSQPQQHNRDDSLIELQTMDGSSFDISSISSSEISVDNLTVIENAEIERTCKLNRTREPLHAKRTSSLAPGVPRTVTFADTPNIIAPPSEAPPPAAEIVLTPSNLTH